ncbi:bifunctional proline dehydrogenase/L-glutamate gamma-semialdehyde dehydrogenase PutA [Roseibium porphyridii]|uniref:Bifunctional protein PutA n=1 Tax=Roseibium porphyridii TaxID=2866279 RepID=A0ABY8F321_9HYPH|nr:bifunctional proline dehydrogenase/L-glutamate gamma-semialdehyde dehydrogenase PutA [Roseibium sp. KMA01]WFE89892.1 bifunctional proline dehydrogenase/L-glutamate gamma-semialdehyde dehydrogenase PutA [Roseibium sp. KMA01]
MTKLSTLRRHIRDLHLAEEQEVLSKLVSKDGLSHDETIRVSEQAAGLVQKIRDTASPGLMDVFLAEYGLSTDEGVSLMCLAEALLRVPDAPTVDDLIEDKIAPSSWGAHLGNSSSPLVNASTWALMLTGKVLKQPETTNLADTLRGAVKRLGEPVIRTAVKRAMKEMGHQFVLGQTIAEAVRRGKANERKGYTYSYDMLGEAALTATDAAGFFNSYADAIQTLAREATHPEPRDNPGISIKLSALHPRYEVSQSARVMDELVPRVKELALLAKNAGMGLNIDAEEADRLDLSLDVIEAVVRSPEFAGWSGFGVVVQAYGKRASSVLDWLYALAEELDRTFMVRLVKGAYWDTEIKQAQVDGTAGFPVFTHKPATDVSYICCARKLLNYGDRIYPQFATHNAHTVCAILEMARDGQAYEFQRLHGMGESLHQLVKDEENTRCRIYAPVGAHRDLLAYLVRRLLENGANSSFVNQIVDKEISPQVIASDPFVALQKIGSAQNKAVVRPPDLFRPERVNSKGWDLRHRTDLDGFHAARNRFKSHQWVVTPTIAGEVWAAEAREVHSPSDPSEIVGYVSHTTPEQVETALKSARSWAGASAQERSDTLNRAADLYEKSSGEIFAALSREAGKSGPDAIAEIREAVDFLRYYGAEAVRLGGFQERGVISCISPWNFPLAIFTGQIAAALAAGNGVLAKPADPTPIVASIGVRLLHKAGVPLSVLQLVPGAGSVVGARITTDPRVNGICFTGSTGVAQKISRDSAERLEPDATFIAETGGLNAMIVDSTALPEQAVKDIVNSAFQSAGQRCSALRVLYLQKDIADTFLEMLFGAMDELRLGNPWDLAVDVGPIITEKARREIQEHVDTASRDGKLLKQVKYPGQGYFVGPAVIEVSGVQDLEKEIFGPVLHVALFEADEIDRIIESINASDYGLTFGLHTRIDDRVQHITSKLNVGNMYVNRNQIGAIVGSQPFGGEGLSGTGPKAGGPHYVKRFKKLNLPLNAVVSGETADFQIVQSVLSSVQAEPPIALETRDMPGPTGESNRWSTYGRGTVLCLGPSLADALEQARIAREVGCTAVVVVPEASGDLSVSGFLDRGALATLEGFDAVALWSDLSDLTEARRALARRKGPLIPLIASDAMADFCVLERHLCIDTTASGGNASLLAAQL